MPKISINIDDETETWIKARQAETNASRTDIVQAALKACMASDERPDEQPAAPARLPQHDLSALTFTVETLFQRYLLDHPNGEETADERWEKFMEVRRDHVSSGGA